jgi:Iap family predicted aminopeptidase
VDYREIDKQILGDIYSSTEPRENLIQLCDEYDSRWPGSGNDRLACEYMVEKLKEYGLEDPHMEEFNHPGWIRGTSQLEVIDPKNKEISCIALPMTCEGSVEGDLVILGDGPVEVYEERKDDIEGNIVMVTSRTPRGMKRSLHRSEKYQRSVLAGAQGWIFMNHYPAYGPPTGGISPIIPAVGVSYEDGSYLARLLERKGKVRVRLETECRNLTVKTWNVVADLPGTGAGDDEITIYGAHYEGHDIAVGALDDATGAICVMETARVLSQERANLKRPMRFILFGSEEIGLLGSRAYVEQHPKEMERIRFMLNFDAAGRAGRQGFNLSGHKELEPLFGEIADAIGVDIPIWQSISPYSDHWPFLLKGVPTGRMGDPEEARRRGGRGFGHTKYDTVDKVDFRVVRECVGNAVIGALRIVNADAWPQVRRSQEEIESLVESQGYRETVALGEKLKDYLSARRKDLRPETKEYLERLKGNWEEVV